MQVVQLVEHAGVAVDDEHVPIAARTRVAGRAAFDPVRLRDRFVGNRVERHGAAGCVIDAVAFVGVIELHGAFRLIAADRQVGEAVDVDAARRLVAAEVRVQPPRAADEPDELCGSRVDRRGAYVLIPPVVGGEQRVGQGREAFSWRRLRQRVDRRQPAHQHTENDQLAKHQRECSKIPARRRLPDSDGSRANCPRIRQSVYTVVAGRSPDSR